MGLCSVPSDFLLLPIPPLEIVPTFKYQAQSLAGSDGDKAATYLAYLGRLTQQYNDVRPDTASFSPFLLTVVENRA